MNRLAVLVLPVAVLLFLSACGGAGAPATGGPFVAEFPDDAPGSGDDPATAIPPPSPPQAPVFEPNAFRHERSVLYGSFPSDVVLRGNTVWTTDADQIDGDGARVVPLDAGPPPLRHSARYATTTVVDRDLVDDRGATASLTTPIGFGFFFNDLLVIDERLGMVLVNAGGSDSAPTLSNLVVFDPVTGLVVQTVNLANRYMSSAPLVDSSGAPVPAAGYVQSGAEAVAYVSTGAGRGRLYVAMTNLLVGAPSYGTARYPGTVQIFDVEVAASVPVRARASTGHVTQTKRVAGFNPVALSVISPDSTWGPAASARLLVTVAGTTAYDVNYQLVPTTAALVEVWDASTTGVLGTFHLGLAGLSATRPAIGRDGAGHRVGFFPSAVTGEIYLLLLDGLYTPFVDPSRLAVLRGPRNGIPITAEQSGGPGGNITGVGLAPDGRALVVSGFGDLFAFPEPLPGRLYVLGLPDDLITGSGFSPDFQPGATLSGTVPGRTLGALVLTAGGGSLPDVYVAVGGPIDPSNYLGTGPGSLGTLETFGLIR